MGATELLFLQESRAVIQLRDVQISTSLCNRNGIRFFISKGVIWKDTGPLPGINDFETYLFEKDNGWQQLSCRKL
jgi:hypothetical protein